MSPHPGVPSVTKAVTPKQKPQFGTALAVDNVIFGFAEGAVRVLLVRRGVSPAAHEWALPGEYVYAREHLGEAAARILRELTGLTNVYLEQVAAFGDPDRHPAGRVVTVAYYSLIGTSDHPVIPQGWATSARYFDLDDLPALAFDHRDILEVCLRRLRERVRRRPIGFELLPTAFTLSDLQMLYEALLGEELDKRNFRKKILQTQLVRPTGSLQEGVSHRPAKLYRFDVDKYERLRRQGFNWDI